MRKLTFKLPNSEKLYTLDIPLEPDEYWWTEGNGSCDCNRMIMLSEKYPEIGDNIGPICGETIELVKVEPKWEYQD